MQRTGKGMPMEKDGPVIFIYGRKSKWTGRGESVENQLAMCREYVRYHVEGADAATIVEYEEM